MTTVYELSKELGIAKRNVHDLIARLGIKAQSAGGNGLLLITEGDADLIRSHCVKYQKSIGGITTADIARQTGVSRSTVWSVVVRTFAHHRPDRRKTIILSQHEADVVRSIINDHKAT